MRNQRSQLPFWILLIAFIILGVAYLTKTTKPPDQKFTRICAWTHDEHAKQDPVCNDYANWRWPEVSGCTNIEITGAPSYVCGDYTLEHRTK